MTRGIGIGVSVSDPTQCACAPEMLKRLICATEYGLVLKRTEIQVSKKSNIFSQRGYLKVMKDRNRGWMRFYAT